MSLVNRHAAAPLPVGSQDALSSSLLGNKAAVQLD